MNRELDNIRRIINQKDRLSTRDRTDMQMAIAHSILNRPDDTFIELCNFCAYASKKALRLRFNY